MTPPFYVTTPIYYVNAKPHLGHTYTTISADVARRFQRMLNKETFFLTGTDEHGDKIVKAAQKHQVSPTAYADQISKLFKDLWPELSIEYDRFIRTTDPDHIKIVTLVLQKIYDAGDIYYSEYEGLYCFECERFYTERELNDGKCPDHGSPPELIKESNYFFKMSRYQDWLITYIKETPDLIRPERYRNEVLGFLREPLEDLCISRPKSRLQWGITLPFDENYVTYVWFDALINYISALGYPDGDNFKKFWPQTRHIVAKDILKPHGIYWPIMLKAAGIDIYRHLFVHGYWNIDESKMSKSLGNVVDPVVLKASYGTDALRYFLMREMTFGLDSNFSETALIQRINSDLANDLGNLFSRVLAMAHKYFSGNVPECPSPELADHETNLKQNAQRTMKSYANAMEGFEFHKALIAIWDFISIMNKYVDSTAPWDLAKKEESRHRLQEVIYSLLEGLRIVAGLIYPVMPGTASTMTRHLGADMDHFFSMDKIGQWGLLRPGTSLAKASALFPRIESQNENRTIPIPKNDLNNRKMMKPEITLEDISKIDLQIATVIQAEKIPKAEKLLKLEVQTGHDKRTVVAGIAKSYSPEEIIGKQVVLIANLKPAKLMGVRSEGMLLAAVAEGITSVVTPEKKVPPGTTVR
jgi:methionyl-tRNA synthetase